MSSWFSVHLTRLHCFVGNFLKVTSQHKHALAQSEKDKMADLDRSLALHEDSPDRRNEREGSRESDQDDRDRRRRGSSYERDLKRESRRYSPYPSKDERESRSNTRGTAGSGDKAENRIFISNLRYTVKWQDLKDHFKKGLYTFYFSLRQKR